VGRDRVDVDAVVEEVREGQQPPVGRDVEAGGLVAADHGVEHLAAGRVDGQHRPPLRTWQVVGAAVAAPVGDVQDAAVGGEVDGVGHVVGGGQLAHPLAGQGDHERLCAPHVVRVPD